MSSRVVFRLVVSAHLLMTATVAYGLDIHNVQWVTIDYPPSAYVMLERPGENGPLIDEFGAIGFDAFVDTGSSGVLLSREVGDILGVQQQQVDGTGAVFSNVGVGGSAAFNVSEQLNVGLAPFHPNVVDKLDDLASLDDVYTQRHNNVRLQVSTIFSSDPVNIVGMPLLVDKVVVIDPTPVDMLDFAESMRSYIYDPGTPFNAASASTDPGIPNTTHQVQLSYGDFSRFTTISPANAEPPSLSHNPFIGPDPVSKLDANPPTDNTPPVTIEFNGARTSGSFLLDTAAGATFISQKIASDLNIRYRPGSFGTGSPRLETFDPDNPGQPGAALGEQFTMTIAGFGGNVFLSGFYLDSMLLRTLQGNGADDGDPNHLNFKRSPVLVNDVRLMDPESGKVLTFDGIFGMNNLSASATVTDGGGFPLLSDLTAGNFEWVVFDEAAGLLSVTPKFAPGDFDTDYSLDCDDIDELSATIANQTNDLVYDLTDDGLVDADDLNSWLASAGSLIADANLDGTVGGDDLAIWQSNAFSAGTAWCAGDFNADGGTDGSDFNLWLEHNGSSAAASTASVPEPSTIALSLVSLLFSVLVQRHACEYRNAGRNQIR